LSGNFSIMSESVQDQLWRTRNLARRARRLAEASTLEADQDRLLRHAADLEAQAAELAHAFESEAPPTQVVQMQAQQQQQQQGAATQADQQRLGS
jgi:hypothetical protein